MRINNQKCQQTNLKSKHRNLKCFTNSVYKRKQTADANKQTTYRKIYRITIYFRCFKHIVRTYMLKLRNSQIFEYLSSNISRNKCIALCILHIRTNISNEKYHRYKQRRNRLMHLSNESRATFSLQRNKNFAASRFGAG